MLRNNIQVIPAGTARELIAGGNFRAFIRLGKYNLAREDLVFLAYSVEAEIEAVTADTAMANGALGNRKLVATFAKSLKIRVIP